MNPSTTPDLQAFLSAAHETHAQQPRQFADELQTRAGTLPADDKGAEAVRWAEHVMLGHLADADALQRFLGALPGGSGTGTAWPEAVARARWALAALSAALAAEPSPGSALPEAARWRALQNVVLALAWSGRTSEASAALRQDEAVAASHIDADARRAYAACANNVAQGLREGRQGPRSDAARDVLMLEAAALARRAWAVAGTWLHVERADYQLARCHAVLGHGAEALRFARACHAACVAHGADADERFLAHEALWHAHRAADDATAATVQREHMRVLLADIADAGMRAWCAQVLTEIDAAAAARP